ncbi:hypothetical protein EIP91_001739 [Steccherinum ochraceum]|uniref:Uncharacterized protein n=1 Tax=Steccherinum ochraceum TaxID=92696 RepID=A0A4R0RDC9_9APHY|nr:hypothetical protein EIP91_001739 [Steccherinum ochraceum]
MAHKSLTSSSTQLDRFLRGETSYDLSSILWERVVSEEVPTIGKWIVYMHRNERMEIHRLVKELYTALSDPEYMVSNWKIYRDDIHLTRLCMDIVLEPGMFLGEPHTFKGVFYGCMMLSVLKNVLMTLRAHYELERKLLVPDGPNTACVKDLLVSMERYCIIIWNHRHVIHDRSGWPEDGPMFESQALWVLNALIYLDDITWPTIPTTIHAAHCLLYFWTYATSHDKGAITLGNLGKILKDGESIGLKRDFVETVLRSDEKFLRDLMLKLSTSLRDDRVTGSVATNVLHLCATLGSVKKSNPLVSIKLPEGTGLVFAVYTMLNMYEAKGTNQVYLNSQLDKYKAELGFIAVIHRVLLCAVREGRTDQLHIATILLENWRKNTQYRDKQRGTFRETALYRASVSIWYDGLDAILGVQAERNRNPVCAEVKKAALWAWRAFGSNMNFSETKRPADKTVFRIPVLTYRRISVNVPRKC